MPTDSVYCSSGDGNRVKRVYRSNELDSSGDDDSRSCCHAQRHCFSSDLHDREQEKLKCLFGSKPSEIQLIFGIFFLICICSVTFSKVYHDPRLEAVANPS